MKQWAWETPAECEATLFPGSFFCSGYPLPPCLSFLSCRNWRGLVTYWRRWSQQNKPGLPYNFGGQQRSLSMILCGFTLLLLTETTHLLSPHSLWPLIATLIIHCQNPLNHFFVSLSFLLLWSPIGSIQLPRSQFKTSSWASCDAQISIIWGGDLLLCLWVLLLLLLVFVFLI